MNSLYKLANRSNFVLNILRNNKDSDENQQEIPIDTVIEAIHNIQEQNDLENALHLVATFTSNPHYDFGFPLPTNFITLIINILREYLKNKAITIHAIHFVGNVWNRNGIRCPSVFFDPELILALISTSLQKDDEDIAIWSIDALSFAVFSTYVEKSNFFKISDLDILISNEIFPKLVELLTFTPKVSLAFLALSCAITKTYNLPIVNYYIKNPKFWELLQLPNTRNLVLSIICNFSEDKTCFDLIFTADFVNVFLGFLMEIDENSLETALEMYSCLLHFPEHGLMAKIALNPPFIIVVLQHFVKWAQTAISPIFAFLESIVYFDPKILEDNGFFQNAFAHSEELIFENKQNFAILLCTYFNERQITAYSDPSKPPLNIALNGGFEFICEVTPNVLNPIPFHVMLKFIGETLMSIGNETFLSIVEKTDLIESLENSAFFDGFELTPKMQIGMFQEDEDLSDFADMGLTIHCFIRLYKNLQKTFSINATLDEAAWL